MNLKLIQRRLRQKYWIFYVRRFVSRCGKLRIYLPVWFYVKSFFLNRKQQKLLPILPISKWYYFYGWFSPQLKFEFAPVFVLCIKVLSMFVFLQNVTHSVEKRKIYSHLKNVSWKQLLRCNSVTHPLIPCIFWEKSWERKSRNFTHCYYLSSQYIVFVQSRLIPKWKPTNLFTWQLYFKRRRCDWTQGDFCSESAKNDERIRKGDRIFRW